MLQDYLQSYANHQRIRMDSRRRNNVLQVGLQAHAWRNRCLVEELEDRLVIGPTLEELRPCQSGADHILVPGRDEACIDCSGDKAFTDRLVENLTARKPRVVASKDAQSLDYAVIAGAFPVDELFDLKNVFLNRGNRVAFDLNRRLVNSAQGERTGKGGIGQHIGSL